MLNIVKNLLLLITFTNLFASAPVVDESDNFANSDSNMHALAHDDNESSYFANQQPSPAVNNQISELQRNVQELKNQLANLKDQQAELYNDLNRRIAALQPPVVKKTPPKTHSNNPAEEQVAYMAAYSFVEKKQFSQAKIALQDFIKDYAFSGYSPNAEYWLGEIYLQEQDFASAMVHFENIINNFPASNKIAAALYKLGVALAANGQAEEANSKFKEVLQKYPDSDAAQLAKNQLN